MAATQLKEEVDAFRKLREHYEEQLRFCGLELNDLPDDVSALLDECVELQRVTKLYDLTEDMLKEFYFTKKKEHIDNSAIVAKMQRDIKKLDKQLEAEKKECAMLEKFITKSRPMSEAQMERNKLTLEAKAQEILKKQDTLNVAEDLNIDELVRKVERLETKRGK